jgi:hypothetical protein
MMSDYFVSYSRQELTFADSFSRRLEKSGYEVWIDFRSLVSGRRWQDQIDEGIRNATTMLLVVSQESMTSPAVYDEWTTALQNNKRIILIIFEATNLKSTEKLRERCGHAVAQGLVTGNIAELNKAGCSYGWDALSQCEWVDFRQAFSKAIQQLDVMLKSVSREATSPAPQSGFRMPPTPRLACYLSWITALLSIPFVIPAVQLVPLPRKLKRRTYDYNIIRLHLIGVIVLWILVLPVIEPSTPLLLILVWAFPALAPLALLALLMYSPGMYRWGGPGGAPVSAMLHGTPFITRPYVLVAVLLLALIVFLVSQPPAICFGVLLLYWALRKVVLRGWIQSIAQPRPVRFTIDYSPMDEGIVSEIVQKLQRAGHEYISSSDQDIDCTLIVLSLYHTSTKLALQEAKQRVYPVLIDEFNVNHLGEDLSQIQWIDLRRAAPTKIELLPRVIHDPDLLSRYLGVPPARHIKRSWVIDFTIATLILSMLAQAIRVLGILGVLALQNDPGYSVNWGPLLCAPVIPIIIGVVSYSLVRDLPYRQITYESFLWRGIPAVFFGWLMSSGVLPDSISFLSLIMFIVVLLNRKELKFRLRPG